MKDKFVYDRWDGFISKVDQYLNETYWDIFDLDFHWKDSNARLGRTGISSFFTLVVRVSFFIVLSIIYFYIMLFLFDLIFREEPIHTHIVVLREELLTKLETSLLAAIIFCIPVLLLVYQMLAYSIIQFSYYYRTNGIKAIYARPLSLISLIAMVFLIDVAISFFK